MAGHEKREASPEQLADHARDYAHMVTLIKYAVPIAAIVTAIAIWFVIGWVS